MRQGTAAHDLDTEIVPALEAAGLPYIGVIPEDRRLVAVTARAMNDCLGGEWLEWEEHADELVENVLIGGIVLDWGPALLCLAGKRRGPCAWRSPGPRYSGTRYAH